MQRFSMKGPLSVHGGAFLLQSNIILFQLQLIGHRLSQIVYIPVFIGQQYNALVKYMKIIGLPQLRIVL